MRRWLAVLLLICVGSCVAFRQTHIEDWQKDKQTYVIFPASTPAIYYLWRPLTHLDGTVTGMRFHIGPHQ